ncbi:2OG-Fe(II) oxygenase [Marinomonas mediterranea]|jgi:Predicted proline hydroxylase|uniref:2OG-Fe(II) oxygenase n=1 Tax=Marinomonas mediterranea (strain ATCC 700492 / JCM 21426 / NBRC 103028 / MMB-1) TaxID=717774 RepID=F2JZP9_MARM1|nr:2OG-Fe(II) oxygenase [Marinomonas mediterranea]ADZ90903.1 2OG-Fe(II) oxygenase [Marinomonas mediterranea MMB-1]
MDLSIMSEDTSFDTIVQAIRSQGWCIVDGFFKQEFIDALAQDAKSINPDQMKQAGIGRSSDHQVALNARRDRIQWIEPDSPVRKQFLEAMEALRVALNRKLILGLWDYEAHFARYEGGAFYEKHVDAFQGRSNRVLSTVLYLNDEWEERAGGEFVLYDEHQQELEIGRYMPSKGRFAIFLSEAFPHEVLPAAKTRYSVAGWFRINNNAGGRLDPNQ